MASNVQRHSMSVVDFACFVNFFEKSIGCKEDLSLAKENYLVAAELGDVYEQKPAPV